MAEGLKAAEVAERRSRYGANALPQKKSRSAARVFAGQFRDVMVLILLACTVASLLLGEYADALTVAVLVLFNALLGFLQERRTEKTLQALAALSAPTANVKRDGTWQQIPANDVVVGDFLRLAAGDRVPADAVVTESVGMAADESLLTGESEEQQKLPKQNLYAGTVILKGHGTGVVTAVGKRSKMGEIAGMLGEVEASETPLQLQLKQLGKVIAVGCLAACAVVSVLGILRGEEPLQMLLTGISLAVAAVPEGLPAIVTVTLALGVGKMAKQNALVRKLYAVETLGCTTVICADKTGTLTENRMAVAAVRLPDVTLTVTPPEHPSLFLLGDSSASPRTHPELTPLLLAGVLCNNASLTFPRGVPAHRNRTARVQLSDIKEEGDPTETALLRLGAEAGLIWEEVTRLNPRLSEIPFDSVRKRMAVRTADPSGKSVLWVKGSPESVLPLCTLIQNRPMTEDERRKLYDSCDEMSNRALRVLAFACRPNAADDREEGLTFLGCLGLFDPPRPDAKAAVAECRFAGIRTVMMTGDHPKTALAMAKKLGIAEEGDSVCIRRELPQMAKDALSKKFASSSLYARVTHADKLRLVETLQNNGETVAMTGDGVNDAPAIRRADIGIAMGKRGTDVAKSAADMVLLDDKFSTIVTAVKEGRGIYANMRKFIRYLLSSNLGEVLTMLLAMVMGMPLPLLPVHILLMNLLTDGLPAIALATEPPEDSAMRRRPRAKGSRIFSDGLGWQILFRGSLIGISTLAAFVFLLCGSGDLATARTGAFASLNVSQLIHVFECSRENGSLLSFSLRRNPRLTASVAVSLLLLFAAVYLPALSGVMGLTPLTLPHLCTALLASAVTPVAVAVYRMIAHKRN